MVGGKREKGKWSCMSKTIKVRKERKKKEKNGNVDDREGVGRKHGLKRKRKGKETKGRT